MNASALRLSAQMTRNADVFNRKPMTGRRTKSPSLYEISAQACINMTGAFFNLAL